MPNEIPNDFHPAARPPRPPMSRRGTVLKRVAARPRPDDWRPDECLSLEEAAALFFPHGPVTEKILRGSVEAGRLAVTQVGRRIFTTPDSVRALLKPALLPTLPAPPAPSADPQTEPPAQAAVAQPAPTPRTAISRSTTGTARERLLNAVRGAAPRP